MLDIRMPGMTGFELAQMIKERKKTARSADHLPHRLLQRRPARARGLRHGAVDYLHKPVNPAILRSKVAVFAELYRKSRELEARQPAAAGRSGRAPPAEERLQRAERDARAARDANARASAAGAARRSCARPTGARTSSWRCWRTSCATRSRRSATRVQILQLRRGRRPELQLGARHDRAAGAATWRAWSTTCSTSAASAAARSSCAASASSSTTVLRRRGRDQPAADRRARPRARRCAAARAAARSTPTATRLAQVFANLLNNAAKYTDAGRPHRARASAARAARRVVTRARQRHRHPAGPAGARLRAVRRRSSRRSTRSRGGLGIGLTLVAQAGRAARRQRRGAQRRAGPRQRVRRAPAAGRRRRQRAARGRRRRAERAARGGRCASWSSTTTSTRPRAWRCCCELMGHEVRVGARRRRRRWQRPRRSRPTLVLLDIGLPGHERLRGRRAAARASRARSGRCWSRSPAGARTRTAQRAARGRLRPPPGQARRRGQAHRS